MRLEGVFVDVTAFLITLREAFEALLIVGIIITYLNRVGASKWNKGVYIGVVLALFASLLVALLFQVVLTGFQTMAGQNYMRIGVLLLSSFLLTHMAVWMADQQKDIRSDMQHKLNHILTAGSIINLIGHSFLVTLREGVETVMFFAAISGGDIGKALTSWGALLGLLVAVVLACLFFGSSKKMSLGTFFKVTQMLIIVIAAGLFSQGIGAMQEQGVVGSIYTTPGGDVGEMYNLVSILPEHRIDEEQYIRDTGDIPVLSGEIGNFLKALLGYSQNPSVEEFAGYWLYYVAVFFLIRYRKLAAQRKGTTLTVNPPAA